MPKLKNVCVSALAGTGKTYTLEQVFRQMAGESRSKTGSPEQNKIWDAIGNTRPRSRAIMAFNRSVKDEWQAKKIPDLKCYTTYGFGLQVLQMNGLRAKGDPQPFKTDMLLEELEGKPVEDMNMADVVNTRSMVNLARLTLTDHTDVDAVMALGDDFGINYTDRVLEWVPKLVDLHAKKTDIIDFTDMVWLPVYKRLQMKYKFDFMGIDECQDLNAAQQALLLVHANRFMLVGDRKQAIYQFAGADERSFDNMSQYLNKTQTGLTELPLNTTRRCCQAVVREANTLVPELKAMPDAPEGSVEQLNYEQWYQRHGFKLTPDDFVICRRNAPLVKYTLSMIARRKPARMIGRDFGRDCKNFLLDVSRGASDSLTITSLIRERIVKQEQAWAKKRFVLDRTKEAFYDKVSTAMVFTSMCATLDEINRTIDEIFLDDKQAADARFIRCSSIHRAKGLEAERVHLLEQDRCGVSFSLKQKDGTSKLIEPTQADFNLRYVGITRAKLNLFMVNAEPQREAAEY